MLILMVDYAITQLFKEWLKASSKSLMA